MRYGQIGTATTFITHTRIKAILLEKEEFKSNQLYIYCRLLLYIHATVHCGQQEQHLFFTITNFQQKINSTNVLYKQETPID